MPKFKKRCHNFFHEEWSSGEEDEWKVENLRARGLGDLIRVLKRVAEDKGKQSQFIGLNMCRSCLKKCLKTPEFTGFLSAELSLSIKQKLKVIFGDSLPDSEDMQLDVDETYADADAVGTGPLLSLEENEIFQRNSESTITLSSPSQMLWEDSDSTIISSDEKFTEKASQTDDVICLPISEYRTLLEKAESYCNFKEELNLLRTALSKESDIQEMDPETFETFCQNAGAGKLFSIIFEAMCGERMSVGRAKLTKLRSMAIVYMMIYGQSQRANWFQVALSRTLKQFGISEEGLIALRNLGIAAHPHTVKSALKSSASSHLNSVSRFFQDAVDNKQFLVVMIDDYHNIHTKHRPESKTQTQAVHMSTLLVKVFPNISAISKGENQSNLLSEQPVEPDIIKRVLEESLPTLSKTYAQSMPDWVVAKYFDQEAQRHRLAVHDYQQTEIESMRKMDHCMLVDCIEFSLKSSSDLLSAFEHMLSNGLSIYLDNFVAPFVGDWPTQFFMRKLAYSHRESMPSSSKCIAPIIGPLHISLNARECVLMNFHSVFADLYSFLFGAKAKLARKPKPWRVSLLLEVMYGGWTLIRDTILSVFSQCKDVQYLTLLNLLDNYAPLVLSIYSIVFKCNNYDLYCQSLLQCWVMMLVFKRRHYDKALLVAISLLRYWKDQSHPFHQVMQNSLVAFDEYPIENFHSVLRARTRATDNGDQINLMAKEIDACKHELQTFKALFVPPRKFAFSSKKINELKNKAAEYLISKFYTISENIGKAEFLPRAHGQRKDVVKCKLPNLFGDEAISNKVLPVGFLSLENPPNPGKKCDKAGCHRISPLWKIFSGCGHSFHLECILPAISTCSVCQETLQAKMTSLGKSANDAVQMSFDGDDGEDDEGSNENEDDDNDDLDNSREEIEIVDDSANVAPQNLVSLIASISTWRRNLAPSD